MTAANIISDILDIIAVDKYTDYGLRVDNIKYNVGDICNNSHSLYCDPIYDEDGDLAYPLIDDGPYAGYYDGGEMDGTCAVMINADNITDALEIISQYDGAYMHLIAGYDSTMGEDPGEIVISDAIVIAVWDC